MEKTIVFALATGQKRFSASLCKLLEKYAEILASQGLLTTAMEYLKLMGSEELSPELTILRDRIALSTEPGQYVVLLYFPLQNGTIMLLTLVIYLFHVDNGHMVWLSPGSSANILPFHAFIIAHVYLRKEAAD